MNYVLADLFSIPTARKMLAVVESVDKRVGLMILILKHSNGDIL